MAWQAPAVSILVPTRNRAGLLRHALATALSQTFADVEIVVSDNASIDATAEVAGAFGDSRVRVVRSERVLSAHDNWELALDHARGEWVTLLPDDDGLLPSAIERAMATVETTGQRALAWSECAYAHPDARAPYLDDEAVNRVVVEPFAGAVEEVDGRAELARLFRRRERRQAPGVVTSLVHRSVLARVRARAGRVFDGPDPFLRAAIPVMATEPSYVVTDLPLTVRGISGATISFGFLHNERDGHDVVREFDSGDLFSEVPLRSRTTANVIAESLLRAKRALPDELDGIEFDPVAYFVTCRWELDEAHRRGDGVAEVREWEGALACQPAQVRAAVRRQFRRDSARRKAREVVRRVPGVRRLPRPAESSGYVIARGEDHGFSDLVGAAAFVDRAVLPRADRAGAAA